MLNLLRSSACHCSARWGGQSTARFCASPRSSSSRAIRHASTVLPMPTSSAISSRTGSSFKAIKSGTSWYGRGSTASWANERNGPALERKPSRTASRSSRHEVKSPTLVGSGRSKRAGSTGSSGR